MSRMGIYQSEEVGKVQSTKTSKAIGPKDNTPQKIHAWAITQPLTIIRAMLEDDIKNKNAPDAMGILALLDCFETEGEVKTYVKTHMILCQVFGLCSKKRARDCQSFSAWTELPPFEQECAWCIWQEEMK